MKRNVNHRQPKRSQGGFTLIEISLVIALILGLITVAFLGVGAYRKGSNKAKCKMQMAQIQKAVRSFQNMSDLRPLDPFPLTVVMYDPTNGIVPYAPVCPEPGGTYTPAQPSAFPGPGLPIINCTLSTGTYAHQLNTLTDTKEW